MAHLVKKPRSPFWALRHRRGGRWIQFSTKLRVNSSRETSQAERLRDQHTAEEHRDDGHRKEEGWAAWLGNFLAFRYGRPDQRKTRERYETAWKPLSRFLKAEGVDFPRQLRVEHIERYFNWRQNPSDARVRASSANTALGEIKFLGLVMDWAIKLEFASHNPCRNLGIRKQPVREKPEFTDEQIALIRENLPSEPEWMRTCFEIAIHQGSRLRGCQISMSEVDLEGRRMVLHEKGHKVFTVPIHPALIPLFVRLKAEGRVWSCEVPVNASKAWRSFFDRIGLEGHSFHCSRVSVISRLARSGVPESRAMRYVGHSSTEIHRHYQRLGVEDLHACTEAVQIPPASGIGTLSQKNFSEHPDIKQKAA